MSEKIRIVWIEVRKAKQEDRSLITNLVMMKRVSCGKDRKKMLDLIRT